MSEKSPAELASQDRAIAAIKSGYEITKKDLLESAKHHDNKEDVLMCSLDTLMERIEFILKENPRLVMTLITNIAGLAVYSVQKAEESNAS